MKRRLAALFMAGVMCAGLAACGQSAETETTAAAAETETAAESKTEAETEAETTEAAEENEASEEETELSGKVTVYMPSPAGLADNLAALFTE